MTWGDSPYAVAVWRIDLKTCGAPDWTLLDDRERAAANAFVHADDRDRYGRVHCALRILLGNVLGVAPAMAPLAIGPSGKPFVSGAANNVTFNLSHSCKTALIAIGRGSSLGVDVEDDDEATDYSEMIDAVFDEAAAERIHGEAEPHLRRALFLRGWTRKEAVAKALGSGFLVDPKRFAVPLDDCGPWTVRLQDLSGADFGLADLSAGRAFGAVALEGGIPAPLVYTYRL